MANFFTNDLKSIFEEGTVRREQQIFLLLCKPRNETSPLLNILHQNQLKGSHNVDLLPKTIQLPEDNNRETARHRHQPRLLVKDSKHTQLKQMWQNDYIKITSFLTEKLSIHRQQTEKIFSTCATDRELISSIKTELKKLSSKTMQVRNGKGYEGAIFKG